MNRILAVAANTYRETVRQRVLYNLVFFALLMTASGLLLGELSIRQDEKIIKDVGLAAMDVFGLLIAVYVGVGLVAREIEKRSLYPLLAKPLDRREFLLGKFGGLGVTLLVNVSVMTLGLYLTLLFTGRKPDLHLLAAVYAIYLSLLLVVALALFFSTIASPVIAALCTTGLVVAGRFSDVIRNMREVAPAVPAWLVKVLYYSVPDFRSFDLKDRVVYGEPVGAEALAWITLYAAAYVAVALGGAMLAFRSRDLD